MKESRKQKQKKKIVSKIKTFSVPFSLEEIQDNINIPKTALIKRSKEEIINKAFKFHSIGNISEAVKYYKYFINEGFKDDKVFSNYGVILKNLGKLKEAEKLYRKAIKINPDYAEVYSNLGLTLKDLDQYEEALDSYLKVVELNPIDTNIYFLITILLKDINPKVLNNSKLKNIFNILLEKTNIPHNYLFRTFEILYKEKILTNYRKSNTIDTTIELLSNDKLIIIALKRIIFRDPMLEKLLTQARKRICYRIANNNESEQQLNIQLIIALAEQCFMNEYIYSKNEDENKLVNGILHRSINGELSEKIISILACYFPLYKLINKIPSLKNFNTSNQKFKELIKLQIYEPLKEIELSKNIKRYGSINNSISQKVKSQYEENPYPRWRFLNNSGDQKKSLVEIVNNEIQPNHINYKTGNKQLKILVAGCGTGQQILQAQRYKNAKIIGIDLSLSSLSYAKRKLNELGIDNVELLQMDILEVELLEENFDVIECSGVLHHMDNPAKGLEVLLGVLKKTGIFKLGLYSELARKDIVEARNYIANKKLQANKDNIRDFRETAFLGEKTALNSLTKSPDFYTLSSCRDLCFHVQEHRFTINQLDETLKSNELEFLGFLLPQSIKSLYKNYFQEDKKQTNLDNWAKFEERHPNTFRGMYQFWVCKAKI